MQGTRAVQVVLGEGEPGILRLILEAQGFDVVGHARDDEELRLIVGLTHPTVIVLDAGISALALVDTQIRSDYVPIVVVWPKDAYTPAAEERVEPTTAFLELGNAVRRVVERHAEPIRVPEAEETPADTEVAPLASVGHRRSGRAHHALVLAAAWTIALTALTAIGLAVPTAFRALDPAETRDPPRDRHERSLTPDRERPGAVLTVEVDGGPPCDQRDDTPNAPVAGTGEGGGVGRGCAFGHAKRNEPSGGSGAHGRPDDPGKGSGRGGSNPGDPSKEPPNDKDGTKGGGRPSDDPGPTDDPGPSGDGSSADGNDPPGEAEHGGSRGGNAGRSGGDEAGSPARGKGSGKD